MTNLNDRVEELWLPIPGFEKYLVSSLGRVFSKVTNRVLKPGKHRCGYLQVGLYKNGGVYSKKLVHRLVLETFCPTLDTTLQTNHVNGLKADNRLDNLEWVTRAENLRHSVYQLGNAHGSKQVGQFAKDGKLIATYRSAGEASRATGVHRRCISKCAKGSRKKAGGYVWKYLQDTNLSKAA